MKSPEQILEEWGFNDIQADPVFGIRRTYKDELLDLISLAQKAERERCAEIIETHVIKDIGKWLIPLISQDGTKKGNE